MAPRHARGRRAAARSRPRAAPAQPARELGLVARARDAGSVGPRLERRRLAASLRDPIASCTPAHRGATRSALARRAPPPSPEGAVPRRARRAARRPRPAVRGPAGATLSTPRNVPLGTAHGVVGRRRRPPPGPRRARMRKRERPRDRARRDQSAGDDARVGEQPGEHLALGDDLGVGRRHGAGARRVRSRRPRGRSLGGVLGRVQTAGAAAAREQTARAPAPTRARVITWTLPDAEPGELVEQAPEHRRRPPSGSAAAGPPLAAGSRGEQHGGRGERPARARASAARRGARARSWVWPPPIDKAGKGIRARVSRQARSRARAPPSADRSRGRRTRAPSPAPPRRGAGAAAPSSISRRQRGREARRRRRAARGRRRARR